MKICVPGPQSSHKQQGDNSINSQKYIVWVKIIFFMPKIVDIKIMFHEDI